MSTVLKSSDLKSLTVADKQRALVRCLAGARQVDSKKRIKEIRKEIGKLERRFAMSTDEMLKQVCAGTLLDEGEIAAWRKTYMVLCAHEKNAQI